MIGIRDWGLGIGDSRLEISNFKFQICVPPSPLHSPLSAVSPRGLTLIEVLISIGILTVGLYGVMMLIPLGKIALMETEKSDRTGACGRAAMREVKVQKFLGIPYQCNTPYLENALVTPSQWNGHTYQCVTAGTSGATEPTWPTNNTTVTDDGGVVWRDVGVAFVVDPLGRTASPQLPNINTLWRLNLAATPNINAADTLFRWPDDLIFDIPNDATLRPRGFVRDKNGVVAPYPTLPGEAALTSPLSPVAQSSGGFSWFFTAASTQQPGTYSVSAVVCYKRVLASDGERVITVTPANSSETTTRCESPSYGGTNITYAGLTLRPADAVSGTPTLRVGEWVLLYSAAQAGWYRVVHAGYSPDKDNPTDATKGESYITLVGPDWFGGTGTTVNPVYVVIVGGVTGVYTTTIQLDNDLIWTR